METATILTELIVGAAGALLGGGAVYGRMTTRIANVEERLDSMEVERTESARLLNEIVERLRGDLRSDMREIRDDLKGDVRELRGRLDIIAHRIAGAGA